MMLPDTLNARWIDSLTDPELQHAEQELRALFARQETAEKALRGATYDLMRGPEALTSAWMRWAMVSNAVRARGLTIRYQR